ARRVEQAGLGADGAVHEQHGPADPRPPPPGGGAQARDDGDEAADVDDRAAVGHGGREGGHADDKGHEHPRRDEEAAAAPQGGVHEHGHEGRAHGDLLGISGGLLREVTQTAMAGQRVSLFFSSFRAEGRNKARAWKGIEVVEDGPGGGGVGDFDLYSLSPPFNKLMKGILC
ncbi:hypothetical protein THAOC_13593, partial [Thalassiosira oceanica]